MAFFCNQSIMHEGSRVALTITRPSPAGFRKNLHPAGSIFSKSLAIVMSNGFYST
jgi:hypothetical protein